MGQNFRPGVETLYASDALSSRFSAVFEDDGDTGYFYAYDRSVVEAPILDAVQIYDADAVVDRDVQSTVEIAWSTDGLKAALIINDCPRAVINFSERCSYCRTEFPPASAPWRHAAWSDAVMKWF